MRYLNFIRNAWRKLGLFMARRDTLQPKDVLRKLFDEVERRKKCGIEERAYVPNGYTVYLCPADYEEMSPLLSVLKDQLRNRLAERIKVKGYKVLSTALSIELREDSALLRNQIVVESAFIKEKTTKGRQETETVPVESREACERSAQEENSTLEGVKVPQPSPEAGFTKIIEDKETKYIENGRVRLQILEGAGAGDMITLSEGRFTFGRGREAQLHITDTEETVSRSHFDIVVKEGHAVIRDLNSLNGTCVNDMMIEEADLKKGDTVRAGKVLLKVA